MSLEKEIKTIKCLIEVKKATMRYEEYLIEQLEENLRTLKFAKDMQSAGRAKLHNGVGEWYGTYKRTKTRSFKERT